jgi:hypothetical protein
MRETKTTSRDKIIRVYQVPRGESHAINIPSACTVTRTEFRNAGRYISHDKDKFIAPFIQRSYSTEKRQSPQKLS